MPPYPCIDIWAIVFDDCRPWTFQKLVYDIDDIDDIDNPEVIGTPYTYIDHYYATRSRLILRGVIKDPVIEALDLKRDLGYFNFNLAKEMHGFDRL